MASMALSLFSRHLANKIGANFRAAPCDNFWNLGSRNTARIVRTVGDSYDQCAVPAFGEEILTARVLVAITTFRLCGLDCVIVAGGVGRQLQPKYGQVKVAAGPEMLGQEEQP